MVKYTHLLIAVLLFSSELVAIGSSSKHMTVKHQEYYGGAATQLEASFVGRPVRIRYYRIDFEAHLGQLMGEPTITSHFKFSFTDNTEIIVGDGAEQIVLRSGWSVGQDGKGYIIPKEQWNKIRITGANYVANIDSKHSILAQTPGLMGRNGEWSQDIPASPVWGTLLYSPNFTQRTLWMNKIEPNYRHLRETWKHAAAEEVKNYVLGNFGETVNSGLYLFDVALDLWPTVPVMERNYPAYLSDLLGTKYYKDPINRQAQALVNQANYYADSNTFSKRSQITDKWFKQFGNRVNQTIKDDWMLAKTRPQELRAEAALNDLISDINNMGDVKEIPKPLLIKLQATSRKVETVPSSSHVHAMLAEARRLLGKVPKKIVKSQTPNITDPEKTVEWTIGNDSYKYQLSGKSHDPRNFLNVTAKALVIRGTSVKIGTPVVTKIEFYRVSVTGKKELSNYKLYFSIEDSKMLKKQCVSVKGIDPFILDIKIDHDSIDGGRTIYDTRSKNYPGYTDYYKIINSKIDSKKLSQAKKIQISITFLALKNSRYNGPTSNCENVEIEIDATSFASAVKQIIKLPFTTTDAPEVNYNDEPAFRIRLHRVKKQ